MEAIRKELKTSYRFIYFSFIYFSQDKSDLWFCLNKKSNCLLGTVEWYSPWKRYCFFPRDETVYSSDCLLDIANFLEQLKK